MAKGARASSIKTNNKALKKNVFGPVETARTERLSAKLLALASQPKPERTKEDLSMDQDDVPETHAPIPEAKQTDEMDVDQDASKSKKSTKSGKGQIERKRSSRKASIVFPKYKKGNRVGKSKSKGKN